MSAGPEGRHVTWQMKDASRSPEFHSHPSPAGVSEKRMTDCNTSQSKLLFPNRHLQVFTWPSTSNEISGTTEELT
jgi:hypothetical protein